MILDVGVLSNHLDDREVNDTIPKPYTHLSVERRTLSTRRRCNTCEARREPKVNTTYLAVRLATFRAITAR